MHKLKKIGKVFTSKFVGTGPSSYKKRIYRAAVSQRLRNTGVENQQETLARHHLPTSPPSLTLIRPVTKKCSHQNTLCIPKATDPAHHFITHTATDDTLSFITQHTKLDTNSLCSPLHSIHTRDNIAVTTCRANVKKLIIY